MAKDYLGSDQRKVRPDDKKDEKEIKVQSSKNIFNISGFNGKINLFYFLVQFLRWPLFSMPVKRFFSCIVLH